MLSGAVNLKIASHQARPIWTLKISDEIPCLPIIQPDSLAQWNVILWSSSESVRKATTKISHLITTIEKWREKRYLCARHATWPDEISDLQSKYARVEHELKRKLFNFSFHMKWTHRVSQAKSSGIARSNFHFSHTRKRHDNDVDLLHKRNGEEKQNSARFENPRQEELVVGSRLMWCD